VREVHAFQVVFRSGEVFTFICPSQEEKESWFISVQVLPTPSYQALVALNPTDAHAHE
jgi:hypothetical protein